MGRKPRIGIGTVSLIGDLTDNHLFSSESHRAITGVHFGIFETIKDRPGEGEVLTVDELALAFAFAFALKCSQMMSCKVQMCCKKSRLFFENTFRFLILFLKAYYNNRNKSC